MVEGEQGLAIVAAGRYQDGTAPLGGTAYILRLLMEVEDGHRLASSKMASVASLAFSLDPKATAALGDAGLSSSVYLVRDSTRLSSTCVVE